ncbi:MAG: tetratricopeptide repeat protein [Candidatus Hodarchaeota archaeon]
MSDLKRKQLADVKQLMYKAKFDEALDIIENLEKQELFKPEDELLSLILRGKIYLYRGEPWNTIEISEKAYQLSQKLGKSTESIDALILKARALFGKKTHDSFVFIKEAENLLTALTNKSSKSYSNLKADILYFKSRLYRHKNDYNNELESIFQCLALREKIGKKIDIADTLLAIGYAYRTGLKLDKALDYATKSLTLQEELRNPYGIANSLYLVGHIYFEKGNFDKAVKFLNQSISIKESSPNIKHYAYQYLGVITYNRGELEKALKNFKKAALYAEKIHNISRLVMSLVWIGQVYYYREEYDQAKKFFERSLALCEKYNYFIAMQTSLYNLVILNLEKNLDEQAQMYLRHLKKIVDQIEQMGTKRAERFRTILYPLTKAIVLKKSGRTRDRAKAEELFKEVIEARSTTHYPPLMNALFHLCDLYLKELEVYDDPEILKEINPLITRLLNISEEEHSFKWLAYAKLLQAKLALIQIDIPKTHELLMQAQSIAESHDLQRLASVISREHDLLLEQLSLWKNLKKRGAPISERIKLSSFDKFIDQFKKYPEIKALELVDEQPILLIIISEGGIPAFSNSFTKDWSFEDGFISNFLTAFNIFSKEVFSKGLDRAMFGEYMLIMEPVGSFSVCYLFKGQSYVAKQKLIQFCHRVQNTASIWKTFEDFHKNHQAIVLSENLTLESLIMEVFMKRSLKISTLI